MVFVTAEIGTNHMGDIKIAKKLIDVAKEAGCDAVKFQKKSVEKIYSKEFLDSKLESPWGTTQREMRTYREFNMKQFSEIDKYCKKKKIFWFASCWDVDSQIQMRKFKTEYNKVASAMLTHSKLLETIAEEKKYTFIATGMSSLNDIKNAIKKPKPLPNLFKFWEDTTSNRQRKIKQLRDFCPAAEHLNELDTNLAETLLLDPILYRKLNLTLHL